MHLCKECPLSDDMGTRVPYDTTEGCPGPTAVEHVGAAPNIEAGGEVTEIPVAAATPFCGRESRKIAEEIGLMTTENRIVDTEQHFGVAGIVVASGPEGLLTQLYGPPAPGTPLPPQQSSTASMPAERPALHIVEKSDGTINDVHAHIDEAVRLIEELDLPGLLQEGTTRITRLTNEVDGTSNPHAHVMQAAAALLLGNLQNGCSAANEFVEYIQAYKTSTGG